MSKFVKISSEVIVTDVKFAEYLRRSDIKPAKKGGAFVGNYEVAPEEFRKYGIVLPKGGMIIPDSEPDELKRQLAKGRDILVGRRNDAIKAAQSERAKTEQAYLAEVSRLLEQYNIPGLGIVSCSHESGNPSWGAVIMAVFHGVSDSHVETKTLLTFGNDAAFLLRTERDPDKLESHVWYAPLAEVEEFLRAEAKIYPAREGFFRRLQELVKSDAQKDHSYPKGHFGFVYETWKGEISGGLSYYPLSPGLRSAHAVRYEKTWPGNGRKFRFCEEDIAELER